MRDKITEGQFTSEYLEGGRRLSSGDISGVFQNNNDQHWSGQVV